jgi:hypothetical protein
LDTFEHDILNVDDNILMLHAIDEMSHVNAPADPRFLELKMPSSMMVFMELELCKQGQYLSFLYPRHQKIFRLFPQADSSTLINNTTIKGQPLP